MNELNLIQQPGIDSLLEILNRERRLLVELEARLGEMAALIASERDLALVSAARQIAKLERQLGTNEVLRAVVVAGIADLWGEPEYDFSLRAIIQRSDPEQAIALRADLDELLEITRSVDSLRLSIVGLARERLEAAHLAFGRAAAC